MKLKLSEVRKNPGKYRVKEDGMYKNYSETKYAKPGFMGFPSSSFAPVPITMIQIYDSLSKQYIVLGTKDFTGKFDDRLNVKFIKIPEEEDLLEFFIKLLEKQQPSIISGWNSKTFDMPYITNRIARVLDGYDGDFYNDYKVDLNLKNSYRDMPNVLRLSPLKSVRGRETHTFDGMDGTEVFWDGIFLLDMRELSLKYGFLGLASYSLKNVANHFGLSQKIDNSMYKKFDNSFTGDGWIEPENPDMTDIVTEYQMGYKSGKYTKEEMQQTVYNRFVEYSLRDIEILAELDEITKYIDSHKGIAYTCGVTMNDNFGTLKHWYSMMYRESYNKNLVLPLKQQYQDENTIFQAGLVRTMPGKYDYITSFDFSSLYPSIIRAFNIGGDSLIKEHLLHQDLKDLRAKFFTHFLPENLNREEFPDIDLEIISEMEPKDVLALENSVKQKEPGYIDPILGAYHPLGKYVIKHKGEINDTIEEGMYDVSLLENSEEISEVLRKHNVCITPNGYYYSKDSQSVLGERMKTIFNQRIKEKKAGQKMAGVVNDLQKSNASEDEINEAKQKQEYHENQSLVLKTLLNAVYGSTVLKVNPFSNGKITGASITISGRFCNRSCALACNNYIRKVIGETITEENKAVLDHIPQIDTDSFYLDLSSFFKIDKLKDLPTDKKIELALKLSSTKLQEIINDTIQKISKTLNLFEPEALNMENEVITSSFISLASKRYFTKVMVNDGVILNEPKLKIVGVSLVSYSTPALLKKLLKPVISIALDGGEEELRDYIQASRKEFGEADPMEFVRVARVNNLQYQRMGNKYKRQKENGNWLTAPLGSASALEHNRIVTEMGITGRFPLIEKGDSLSYVYSRVPNSMGILGSIGFTDPKFSKEIDLRNIADYTKHWEKDFINKIDIIIRPLKWDIHRRTARADFKW